MTDAEQIEAFRKAFLRQAYLDFLAWAWAKDEIMEQYHDFRLAWIIDHAEGDEPMGFVDWVTETYWGEVE